MLSLYKAQLSSDTLPIISEVFTSGAIAAGKYEQELISEITSQLKCANVSIINNYSSAISMGLRVADINIDDVVLCKSFSCLNTTSPVLALGARIAWVDLERNSTDICLADLERKIRKYKPKVFLNYHISGYVDDLEAINELCNRYNVRVIQDCNALIYSKDEHGYVCNLSDITVYSLYPNRLINSIDGGVLVFRKHTDLLRADKLKRLGIPPLGFRDSLGEIDPGCDIEEVGVNCTNSNVANLLALYSLGSSQALREALSRNVKYLKNAFSNSDYIQVVRHKNFNNMELCWNFLILVDSTIKRELIKLAKVENIELSTMHINNHLYSAFPEGISLENTNEFYSNVLAVPCGPWLSIEQVGFIATTLMQILIKLDGKNV
ncbi:DegT/DnrJ/EryC1/StrS family aminotransferase [Shewanella sp. ENK2]|uniref:DegT/DnrJ/EryC1/StrS family aminotransferase n=1 Tax=Shewanella sp. ENK2 TaxID=2775245 RepID=UPI0037492C5A